MGYLGDAMVQCRGSGCGKDGIPRSFLPGVGTRDSRFQRTNEDGW